MRVSSFHVRAYIYIYIYFLVSAERAQTWFLNTILHKRGTWRNTAHYKDVAKRGQGDPQAAYSATK